MACKGKHASSGKPGRSTTNRTAKKVKTSMKSKKSKPKVGTAAQTKKHYSTY